MIELGFASFLAKFGFAKKNKSITFSIHHITMFGFYFSKYIYINFFFQNSFSITHFITK